MATPALSVPAQRTETRFEDYKAALTSTQAVTEANRCLYCFDAPCIEECPTDINIPEFIRKIATENLKGSARTIFSANILGMSCARVCPVEVLCAGACVYNEMGSAPVAIGQLQRYATDAALTNQWRYFEAGADTGKSVGLVGGGPASLAAAHELRRLGHGVTIYEKREVLGGLNTWAIAPYKLRADRALEEVDWVLGIGGIEVKTQTSVGEHVSWDELTEKHDALFVGLGLGADQYLQLPGAQLDGIDGAVAYIERMKTGEVPLDGIESVAIIGGGNTALDAVREMLQLGVPKVTLVYRRSEDEMPGYRHEWDAGKKEGARVHWRSLPVSFHGEGKVQRMRCAGVDAARKPIVGSEFDIDVDLVLFAIGQEKLGDLVAGLDGVEVDRGKLVIDERGATGRPGVYSGGDCVNGGKEVVNAVADGKLAAQSMHTYLMKAHGGEQNG